VADFDLVWLMAGYGRKEEGKRRLEKLLKEGVDYVSRRSAESEFGKGSSPASIHLTNRAAKRFVAAAHTSIGDKYREYLISTDEEYQEVKKTGVLSGNYGGEWVKRIEGETQRILTVADRSTASRFSSDSPMVTST
jgi:Txe/YoeB family toxin of Txe-Axe toxin-antitoxin module